MGALVTMTALWAFKKKTKPQGLVFQTNFAIYFLTLITDGTFKLISYLLCSRRLKMSTTWSPARQGTIPAGTSCHLLLALA
jgi:hypothetical protein